MRILEVCTPIYYFPEEMDATTKRFPVIVIGGGHAGCEATLACARRGVRTLLITANIDQIGAMSCNPAIGGLGKGQLVREIDALGGEMAKNIDETGIQFRKLNTNKGTAVQGTRAQADKYLYKARLRYTIECEPNVLIKQGIVKRILVRNGHVEGVELTSSDRFFARAVVVTTGTFLRGLCHVGLKSFSGGRAGEAAANDLSRSLNEDCGLELMRLKTGTVPRLDGKTIDYSGLEEQTGDTPLPLFSFSKTKTRQRQVSCFITYTNDRTHEIIRRDIDKSPMFRGVIEGVGPRYCPSIEDKVVRFANKRRHQVFLEPEGLMTKEVYPNGLSTSLPLETQIEFIQSIPGLERAEITRPGYAVEYDAINPIQIKANYESKTIQGLFLAGQINGTSGYEEAAAQGLMAGINAGQLVLEKSEFILGRDQAYIGVLTDDLVTKGIGGEPYRMFTSRAEYRLSLREDNADIRLREFGYQLGLVGEAEFRAFEDKRRRFEEIREAVRVTRIKAEELVAFSGGRLDGGHGLRGRTWEQVIRRPETRILDLKGRLKELQLDGEFDEDMAALLFSEIRYGGYIQRYQREIDRMQHYDKVRIPRDLRYHEIPSLSTEVKERLSQHLPETLGQALRIPGVTPVAVAQLEVHIANRR